MDTTGELLTIKEVAERLGCSEKTVRRHIKAGKLPAEIGVGPYGPEYKVPAQALDTAGQVLEVVKFERAADPLSLALAVSKAVQDSQEPLYRELAQLREEIANNHRELLTKLTEQRVAEPIEQAMQTVVVPPKKVPWWQFWRGSNETADETGEAISASS